ncbi:MAG: hypothetical protein KGQ26_01070 [Rhodospirillales bacterium]|nr:hypothetical protein [Rhodospirillales bacterium]MDE2319333.1 hypothetical protein [Rhodospirillales bacterium]
MIVRPFTFLTALLFALSGAYLFVVKHQSQSLEAQLEQSAGAIRQDEAAIRVLRAQWALEADPSRIASLATQFTGLQPMKPVQLVTLASLANTLPEPGSSAPYNNPEDEVPGLPGAGTPPLPMGPPIEVKGRVAAVQSTARGFSANTGPMQQIDASLPKPPPVRPRVLVQHGVVHLAAKARPHPVQSFATVYETSARAIPGLPMSHLGRRLPLGAQVVRIRATAQPGPEVSAAPLGGGSLLGMAQAGGQN